MTIVRSAVLEYSYIGLIILGLIQVFSGFRFFRWVSSVKEKHLVSLFVGFGLVPLFIFGSYCYEVGFPKEPRDWSTFGTMAAGCFTGMAAFFTLATLTYTKQQNDELREERKTELQLVKLDSYVKHKEQFFELLKEIERFYENKIFFSNYDALYRSLFEKNSIRNVQIELTNEEYRASSFYQNVERQLERMAESADKLERISFETVYVGKLTDLSHLGVLAQGIRHCLYHLSLEVKENALDNRSLFYEEQPSIYNYINNAQNFNHLQGIVNFLRDFAGLPYIEIYDPSFWGTFSNPCTLHKLILKNHNSLENEVEQDILIYEAIRRNALVFSAAANSGLRAGILDGQVKSILNILRMLDNKPHNNLLEFCNNRFEDFRRFFKATMKHCSEEQVLMFKEVFELIEKES